MSKYVQNVLQITKQTEVDHANVNLAMLKIKLIRSVLKNDNKSVRAKMNKLSV